MKSIVFYSDMNVIRGIKKTGAYVRCVTGFSRARSASKLSIEPIYKTPSWRPPAGYEDLFIGTVDYDRLIHAQAHVWLPMGDSEKSYTCAVTFTKERWDSDMEACKRHFYATAVRRLANRKKQIAKSAAKNRG